MSPSSSLVVAANRGPISFARDAAGALVSARAAGGLVASLSPALAGSGAVWLSVASTPEDRDGLARGLTTHDGIQVGAVAVEADEYRRYYDVVSNTTLWYLHHGMFDAVRRPSFDSRWRQAWESYRAVNAAMAEAVAEHAADGATVVAHDYHLALVPNLLRTLRPDLRVVHFHHTPFCDPVALGVLPDDVAADLLRGIAAADACGFHSPRWAARFTACCQEVLDRASATFVSQAAPDVDDLRKVASSDDCQDQLERIERQVGNRTLIARVDRIELSKNMLRGFAAYDTLLQRRPDLHDRVVFHASVYPSRESLPDYQAYRQESLALVERINQRWGTPDWTPIVLDATDQFTRSVALLRRYDVLLVNPIRDGLNLVAKEGPILNERDGVLVLSRQAGVFDELGEQACLAVNPFDIDDTVDALTRAIDMNGAERARRASALRAVAEARSPHDWLDDQLRAAKGES